MRTWLHLALWGALFLGACSSGGPGGLVSFQSVREAPDNSLEGPAGGNESSGFGGEEATGNNNPGQNGTRDSGVGTLDGSGGGTDTGTSSGDGSVKTDTGGGTTDAAAHTCADLQTCCDSFDAGASTHQACQNVIDNGNDSTCSQYYDSFVSAGYCQ